MKQTEKLILTIMFLSLSIINISAGHAQAGVSGKSYTVMAHTSKPETVLVCFIFAEDGTFLQPGHGDILAHSGSWTQEGIRFEVIAHEIDQPDNILTLTGIAPNNLLLGTGDEPYEDTTSTFFGRASNCADATY